MQQAIEELGEEFVKVIEKAYKEAFGDGSRDGKRKDNKEVEVNGRAEERAKIMRLVEIWKKEGYKEERLMRQMKPGPNRMVGNKEINLRRQWSFGVHTTVMVRGRRLFASRHLPVRRNLGKRCAQSFGKPFGTSVVGVWIL